MTVAQAANPRSDVTSEVVEVKTFEIISQVQQQQELQQVQKQQQQQQQELLQVPQIKSSDNTIKMMDIYEMEEKIKQSVINEIEGQIIPGTGPLNVFPTNITYRNFSPSFYRFIRYI